MILDFTLLYFFIPVFFIISITPGLCMTLSLTMGMAIGIRNTMKMMIGELTGVLLISLTAVVGGGTIIANYPNTFEVFKYLGGGYLIFVGMQMWKNLGKMSLNTDGSHSFSLNGFQLASQGFITAIANPKGWAFFLAMVPSFMNSRAARARAPGRAARAHGARARPRDGHQPREESRGRRAARRGVQVRAHARVGLGRWCAQLSSVAAFGNRKRSEPAKWSRSR